MKRFKLTPLRFISIFIITIVFFQACKTYYFRSDYKHANELLHSAKNLETKPFLKAHLKNGDVCILKDSWQIDTIQNVISGNGMRYNFNRVKTFEGKIKINLDSVALYETNKKLKNTETDRITALTILAVADLLGAIACATNPKACFGSCPTFYINENDNYHHSNAEGFSSAILPSLEYADIDALDNKTISNRNFSITMKNEAAETHCVKNVKLLAYPREKGQKIYQSPHNDFYLCKNTYKINDASGENGDISPLLKDKDQKEWFSLSDENNMNSKENIYVDFDNIKDEKNLGLIINFRQTLMTTYLIYNAMGYMGDEVSDFFAKAERSKTINNKLKNGLNKILGNIDIYAWNENKQKWSFQGSFNEIGPIAINHQLIPLKNSANHSKLKLKIVLNKGYWRIDYLALTNIAKKVKPIELYPKSVLNKNKLDSKALEEINSPDKYLVSMPGDKYKLNFVLPKNNDYELFVYSKGYYLEWMRKSWYKHKNLLKLNQMFNHPKKYLKSEAKNYKRYESLMEEIFWNSKLQSDKKSCYEN